MSFKTILLHADASRSAPQRLQLAAMLAGQEQAHLVCAAMTGISRHVYRQHEAAPHGVMRADLAEQASQYARGVLDNYAGMADRLGIQSCEQRLVNDDAYGGLLQQARYADLLIVGQPDRDDPATGAMLQDLPEYLLLNSVRPVLVVPFAGAFPTCGSSVLAGWDGSDQAARAITLALPILRRAGRVRLALLDPVIGNDEHGEEPGADMALYLARQGVKVEVTRLQTDDDAGSALLSMAQDAGADLLVMGGYGHARMREIMLGGATRTVLNTMTLPVLMAH